MLVSAISVTNGINYNAGSAMPYYSTKNIDKVNETVFNSSTPLKKNNQPEKMLQVLNSINEWQNFCHRKILGQKLDIMA